MPSNTNQQTDGTLVRPDGRPLKLKDSCDACGRSKVKCSREKPTCKRCATHGWACEYGASHRTGRIPSKAYAAPPLLKPRPSGNDQQLLDDLYTSPSRGDALYPGASNGVTPAFSDLPPQNAFTTGPDTWSGMGDEFSLLSPPASSSSGDLDCFWPAYADTMGLDGLLGNETIMPGQVQSLGPTLDAQGFPSSEFDEFRSSAGLTTPQLGNTDGISRLTTNHPPSSGESHGPGDGCLLKALALLPHLSAESVSVCSQSRSPSAGAEGTGASTQSAVTQDGRSLRTVQNILECQCSRDEYLTSLLAVVVLKILARFTSAVHQSSVTGSAESPFSTELTGIRDTASRSILDELLILQSVVQLLGQRLRENRSRGMGGGVGGHDSDTTSSVGNTGHSSLSAFSTLTVEQLELELQSRLEMVTAAVQRSLGHY